MVDWTRRTALACCLLGPVGCGGDDGSASMTGLTGLTGSADSTGTSDGATTTAAVGDDDHGYVCIDLNADPELPAFWIEQTAAIQVRLHYTQCLRDFYLASPEYRRAGVAGEPVFQRWASALCTPDADRQDPVDCAIAGPESFEQLLGEDADPAYALQITYEVEDSSTVAGGRLRFGPLPLEALAECSPTVTISELADIQGLDYARTPLWQIESFANTPSAARLSEGGCVDISIGI